MPRVHVLHCRNDNPIVRTQVAMPRSRDDIIYNEFICTCIYNKEDPDFAVTNDENNAYEIIGQKTG